MSLPFEPEPFDQLKARYAPAFEKLFDAAAVAASTLGVGPVGGHPRPGESRAHVFDFEDGFRMIASRETYNGVIYFHHSFSAPYPGTWAHTELQKESNFAAAMVRLHDMGFILITRLGGVLPREWETEITPRGVVHIMSTELEFK